MIFNRATSMSDLRQAVWTNIVCIKYYELSMFLCYNFYIDGNIPFWVLLLLDIESVSPIEYCV